jgi:hypothetical protein
MTDSSSTFTCVRYFLYVGAHPYSRQPPTGFSTCENAHAYADAHTMLTQDRYTVECVHLQAV